MDPWSQSRVEELQPLTADMEHEGVTEEEVFQTETSRHSTEIEEIPVEILYTMKSIDLYPL